MEEDLNSAGFEEFKNTEPATLNQEMEFDFAVKKKQKNLGGRDRLYSSSEIIKP